MPKVYIVILNWNGLKDTLECLESLKKIDYPNYKIIVIDNGSIDSSAQIISQKYPDIIFIGLEENLGFAGGNNVGIKYALDHGADYFLLLNNDTTVEQDFLKILIEVAEKNKKFGILGPVIYFYSEPEKIQFAGGKINWLKTKGEHIGYGIKNSKQLTDNNKSKEVDYITGCCLLIKKEVIKKIGLLSEDYFLYYEDADLCLRAKKAGYKCVLAASARIYHKHSKSTIEFSFPYIYYHSRNGLIFSSRFGFRPLTYLISLWIFLKQIIKLVIGYKKDWARPVMKGVVDFWKGRKGKLGGYY